MQQTQICVLTQLATLRPEVRGTALRVGQAWLSASSVCLEDA